MFAAVIEWTSGPDKGQARLGPADSRDEASRLARSWMEANAGAQANGARFRFGNVRIEESEQP